MDTNVLIEAHRRESPRHARARRCLTELAEGRRPWAIPWPCCHEFLSVVTNRRIWQASATLMPDAWRQLRTWTGSPSNRVIGEGEEHLDLLGRLMRGRQVRGPVVHDARVAAICLAHRVDELWTRDRDFSLFPELRTRDPLRD